MPQRHLHRHQNGRTSWAPRASAGEARRSGCCRCVVILSFLSVSLLVITILSFVWALTPDPLPGWSADPGPIGTERYPGIGVIPSDWVEGVQAAETLVSTSTTFGPDDARMTSVGNGYLATTIFSSALYVSGLFNGPLPTSKSRSATRPSHRASIPSPVNIHVVQPPVPVAGSTHAGTSRAPRANAAVVHATALDMRRGVVSMRMVVDGTLVEQSWYAHRKYRHLLVMEINATNPHATRTSSLSLMGSLPPSPLNDLVWDHYDTVDHVSSSAAASATSAHDDTREVSPSSLPLRVWHGQTRVTESPGDVPIKVAVVCNHPLPPSSLTTTATTTTATATTTTSTTPWADGTIAILPQRSRRIHVFCTVRTTLPNDSRSPVADALADHRHFVRDIGPDLVRLHHEHAWNEVWSSGIDVEGNIALSRIVRSSYYYLLSSARADWPWGLSPGGLSSNAYNGHSFWDTETWMFPSLLPFHTNLSRSLLRYRYNHMAGARLKATSYGHDGDGLERKRHGSVSPRGYWGSMFPWESAYSGEEVCPSWAPTGTLEQHISGDIALAARQYWYATGDTEWLRKVGRPLSSSIAEFWMSRVDRTSSTAKSTANDRTATNNSLVWSARSATTTSIRGVIPPDEYAFNVNNSAFTNAVAALSLRFAAEVDALLDRSARPADDDDVRGRQRQDDGSRNHHMHIVGERRDRARERRLWLRVATELERAIPFDHERRIHLEYDGYLGASSPPPRIKQADVILLGFPLMYPMDRDVRLNDLRFYNAVTDPHGPAMTWSMACVGYLEAAGGGKTGETSDYTREADMYFRKSFVDNVHLPFGVWFETPLGGATNFITGAGGFLQAILYGYGGMRISNSSLQFNPVLPPDTTSLRFKHVKYLGFELDVSYDQLSIRVRLSSRPGDVGERGDGGVGRKGGEGGAGVGVGEGERGFGTGEGGVGVVLQLLSDRHSTVAHRLTTVDQSWPLGPVTIWRETRTNVRN